MASRTVEESRDLIVSLRAACREVGLSTKGGVSTLMTRLSAWEDLEGQ